MCSTTLRALTTLRAGFVSRTSSPQNTSPVRRSLPSSSPMCTDSGVAASEADGLCTSVATPEEANGLRSADNAEKLLHGFPMFSPW